MKKIELAGVAGRGVFVLVDDDDYEFLAAFDWNVSPKGYAIRTDRTSGKKRTIYLHIVVAQRAGIWVDDKQVDHIDGDKLDNRRLNLRAATNQQNQANVKRQRNNSSGFKGVTLKNGKYHARIGVSYKRIHLGCFETAEEAHEAYKAASCRFFGEFAEH